MVYNYAHNIFDNTEANKQHFYNIAVLYLKFSSRHSTWNRSSQLHSGLEHTTIDTFFS